MQVNRLDLNREKRVLVNLILNTDFCRAVLPVIDVEYFNAQYARTLIEWVQVYYESYSIAPKGQINEMFEEYGTHLDTDIHQQIGKMLQHLSDVSDTQVHNIQYLIDSADDLFREKHIELQNKASQQCLESNDLVGAEKALEKHYVGVEGNSHDFIAFNDDKFMRSVVRDMIMQQDPDNAFFTFSGRLGEFLGPIDRGWFVAFLAPAKRGKTTYMVDAAIDAVRQRKNTIILSLEMPEKQLMQRYALSITGCKPETEEYTSLSPIMDCTLNQEDECDLAERVGVGMVDVDDEGNPMWEENEGWEVCTVCRGKPTFRPTSWKIPITRALVNEGDYLKKIKKFNKFFGKYGRIVHMPSKTVTVQDIRAEVSRLEYDQNFIPDIVVLDYADLIKPNNGGEKRHQLDDIWEYLRGWGQENSVTIISASQTNRVSADAEYLKDTHVAEDYSKIAKLDLGIGLCQTDKLKERGVMNINIVAHRHKGYIQSNVCTVLQDMAHQQSHLDSDFAHN